MSSLMSASSTFEVEPLKVLFIRPFPNVLRLSNVLKLEVGLDPFPVTNLKGLPYFRMSGLIVLENLLKVDI